MAMDRLSASRPLGWLLRLPLRLIPRGALVPILATPARGKRWIVGAGPHSCWLGFNELRKRRRFEAEVNAGDVVYDIGANVGSYTILASVLVGVRGRVVAFEPVAENLRYLKEHVRINRLDNVTVIASAVGERMGETSFLPHPDRLQGRIDPSGTEVVPVVRLDDWVATERAPPPSCLKIDVEGGEEDVLTGASEVLRTRRPVVFLATHGEDARMRCLALLDEAGYEVGGVGQSGDEWVAHPRTRSPHAQSGAVVSRGDAA
jgi:FkbM family methyltransferase